MVRNLWRICNILYTGNTNKEKLCDCFAHWWNIWLIFRNSREEKSATAEQQADAQNVGIVLLSDIHCISIKKSIHDHSVYLQLVESVPLEQPPLYKGHLSTAATPYNGHCCRAATHFHPNQEICSYFNFPAMASSLQWPVNSVPSPQGGCCRKVPL